MSFLFFFFFFQAEDGIRDLYVTGVQTCALPICCHRSLPGRRRGTGWSAPPARRGAAGRRRSAPRAAARPAAARTPRRPGLPAPPPAHRAPATPAPPPALPAPVPPPGRWPELGGRGRAAPTPGARPPSARRRG